MFKYFRTHVSNKKAREWWSEYLRGSYILRRIGRYLIYCAVLHVVFFWKPVVSLLIIFTISTLINLYAFVYAIRKSALYVEANVFPNDTMTGYLIMGMFRFFLGILFLIPGYLAISQVLSTPITIGSFLVTYAFSIPAWAFYLVIRSLERDDE